MSETEPTSGGGWRTWLGWIVLAALVVALARAVDWRPALAAAAHADRFWLLAAVALDGAILLFSTAQWWVLLPSGADLSPGELFGIVALSSSFANAGPLLTGQAAGIHLLAGRGRLGHTRALSTTVLEQLTEGMAKLALLAGAVLVLPRFQGAAAAGVALLAVPAAAVGLALASHRADAVEALAARVPGALAAPARFLAGAIRHLDALRRPHRFLAGWLMGIAKKAAEGLAIAAVAAALGVPLPAWAVLASLAAVNLSQLVAVTPGNLGPYEAGAFLVYRAAGVDAHTALALALIQHAAYLLPLSATGWFLEVTRLVARPRHGSDGASAT